MLLSQSVHNLISPFVLLTKIVYFTPLHSTTITTITITTTILSLSNRHFMRGDVIAFSDYERFNGDRLKLMIEAKLKNETKKYIVNDGDIIEFFNHTKK